MLDSPASRKLLGLAEELTASEAPVGDPATEQMVIGLLDRLADAIVDVAVGRDSLARPRPPAGAATAEPGAAHLDAATCSALAARCHQAAHAVGSSSEAGLAGDVSSSLVALAEGLQRLVQDVPTHHQDVFHSGLELRVGFPLCGF